MLNNGQLDEALPGMTLRNWVEIVLAHELMHFRNRIARRDGEADTVIDAARYVDTAMASSFADTQVVRASYVDEVAARHVAWQVQQDRLGAPHALTPGALFVAAQAFAAAAVSPQGDYNDNGYMAALLPTLPAFGKQVGVWLGQVAGFGFHDDGAVNGATQQAIRDEVTFVQPSYATPLVFPSGMA